MRRDVEIKDKILQSKKTQRFIINMQLLVLSFVIIINNNTIVFQFGPGVNVSDD